MRPGRIRARRPTGPVRLPRPEARTPGLIRRVLRSANMKPRARSAAMAMTQPARADPIRAIMPPTTGVRPPVRAAGPSIRRPAPARRGDPRPRAAARLRPMAAAVREDLRRTRVLRTALRPAVRPRARSRAALSADRSSRARRADRFRAAMPAIIRDIPTTVSRAACPRPR